MDKALTMTPDTDAAIVAFANWFQFAPAETVTNPCVESRMFLWCHAGKGRVRINGSWSELMADDWVFLPWRHEIAYEADAREPFLVGGIHIIPRHDPAHTMEFTVAHQVSDHLARQPWRQDVHWPLLAGVVRGTFASAGPLRLLAEYIVESFRYPYSSEPHTRMLARIFIAELLHVRATGASGDRATPSQLRRMQEYILAHLDKKLSVAHLAKISNCSKASVHRLFRDFTGASPSHWIALRRVKRAQQLLSSTMMKVKEVGQQVGMPDQFHFSRFFKQHAGASPTDYQRRTRFI